MKSIHSRFFIFFLMGLLLLPFYAYGNIDTNTDFCQDAQTTADLVSCTKKRLDIENSHMNKLYDKVISLHDSDKSSQATIEKQQAAWIELRDQTCSFERSLYEGGSLERVQEFTCLSRITSNRSSHFESVLSSFDELEIPVFSTPPRWTNVISDEYKDIFWALAAKINADTDCDDVDEVIVKGVREVKPMVYKTVLAIADSEKTGKPTISLLNFNDKQNCDIMPKIDIKPLPPMKPDDTQENESIQQCTQQVKINTKNCGSFIIKLDKNANSYTLAPDKK